MKQKKFVNRDISISLIQTIVLTDDAMKLIIQPSMPAENRQQVEFPIGSKDWFQTLSVKDSTDGKSVTSVMHEAADEVLDESFTEIAWNAMFVRTPDSMYGKDKGNSRTAPAMMAIAKKFGWSAQDPEFRYTAAQVVTQIAEKTFRPKDDGDLTIYRMVGNERVEQPRPTPEELPLEAMREKLRAYAERHKISAERQQALTDIAATPLLNNSKKTRALDLLQRQGADALIRYMTPLRRNG